MSKQIALLIDDSGSMFSPVAGGGTNDKIYEASQGAQLFIANLLSELTAVPGSEFAFSVHRFASSYQVMPGGGQVNSTDPGFAAALTAMQASIPTIENQAASQAAVGNLTDLYTAVHQTAVYMVGHNPSFGIPSARYILLFSDGIQTIAHNGAFDRAGYEAEQGVMFNNILASRDIRLRAWGIGSNALANVLVDLTNQAVDPTASDQNVLAHPGSYTKVFVPVTPAQIANFTTVIAGTATALVDDNGVLPLRPAAGAASDGLWEQFVLPESPTSGGKPIPFKDFEVDVDGSTEVFILGLVLHSTGDANLRATSPSGAMFSPGSPGTRPVQVQNATLFKIPNPEEGTWKVRVTLEGRTAVRMDLMARGAFKAFNFAVSVDPFQIAKPGRIRVTALPSLKDAPAAGRLEVTAQTVGGKPVSLAKQKDGTFSGHLAISRPGLNTIRAAVAGKLEDGRSVSQAKVVDALVGPALDPRLKVTPDVYAQGRRYQVALRLIDARFQPQTRISFGSGIEVVEFAVKSESDAAAQIQVAKDAFLGEREVVAYDPHAESVHGVRVVKA